MRFFLVTTTILTTLLMFACSSDRSVTANNEQNIVNVTFGYTNKTQTRSRVDKIPTAIVLTIEQGGTVIHSSKELTVQDFNGTIITEPLPLLAGTYEITEYKVKNAANEVIYATPEDGSTAGKLVNDPLSISFTVSDDNTQTIVPEVLDTEGYSAQDFGFPPFGFKIVPTMNFLVAVKYYDVNTSSYIMTDAHVEVTSNGRVDFEEEISAATTSIRIRDIDSTYVITITKDGFAPWVRTLTNTEVKTFASLPLSALLSKNNVNVIGFTDEFAAENWTTSGIIVYNISETELSFNCATGAGGGVTASITVPTDGVISFDWNMVVTSAGHYGEPIRYTINGVNTTLSEAGTASGSESGITVSAGDIFELITWGSSKSAYYHGSFSNFGFTAN